MKQKGRKKSRDTIPLKAARAKLLPISFPFYHIRWGLGQREVVCGKWAVSREAGLYHASSHWLVEAAKHPALEAVEAVRLAATFWEKFISSHQLMFESNKKMGRIGEQLEKNHLFKSRFRLFVFTGDWCMRANFVLPQNLSLTPISAFVHPSRPLLPVINVLLCGRINTSLKQKTKVIIRSQSH